ncbi:MAG TPA: hypothetical protein PL033_19880 [Candidatus Brocadiia bacterium]|nr:hypothetical protein [Candidatus Brocadiia bacterium]
MGRPSGLPFSRRTLDDGEYVKLAIGELVYWRTTSVVYVMMGVFAALVTVLLVWQLCAHSEQTIRVPLVCAVVMATISGGMIRACLSRAERRRLMDMMVKYYDKSNVLEADIKAMSGKVVEPGEDEKTEGEPKC